MKPCCRRAETQSLSHPPSSSVSWPTSIGGEGVSPSPCAFSYSVSMVTYSVSTVTYSVSMVTMSIPTELNASISNGRFSLKWLFLSLAPSLPAPAFFHCCYKSWGGEDWGTRLVVSYVCKSAKDLMLSSSGIVMLRSKVSVDASIKGQSACTVVQWILLSSHQWQGKELWHREKVTRTESSPSFIHYHHLHKLIWRIRKNLYVIVYITAVRIHPFST